MPVRSRSVAVGRRIAAENRAFPYAIAEQGVPLQVDALNGGFAAISYHGPPFCMAVDGYGSAFWYTGSGWSSAVIDYQSGILIRGVSCPAVSMCVAVDNGGQALTYNGHSWSAPAVADKYGRLMSVSCASRSYCAAVADSGDITIYNGSTWTLHTPPTPTTTYLSETVSCPAANLCLAGFSGDIYSFAGGKWKLLARKGAQQQLAGLSCPAVKFCLAVSDQGYAIKGT